MKKTNEILGKKEFVITLDDAYEMMCEIFDNPNMGNYEKTTIVNKIQNAVGYSNFSYLLGKLIGKKY